MVYVKRICSICEATNRPVRCNASPFPGLCCEDCADRWVIPVRVLIGAQAFSFLLPILRSIAKEARHVIEKNNKNGAQVQFAGCDDPDS